MAAVLQRVLGSVEGGISPAEAARLADRCATDGSASVACAPSRAWRALLAGRDPGLGGSPDWRALGLAMELLAVEAVPLVSLRARSLRIRHARALAAVKRQHSRLAFF